MKSKGNVVRQRLIAAVSRYARLTRKQVTVRQFCKAAKVEEGRVHELFPGGIRELLAAAGLGQRVSRRVRIDFEGLMVALEDVAQVIGRVPTPGDMDKVGKVTSRTYYDRMKNWGKVREEFERWRKRKGNIGTAAHFHIDTSGGEGGGAEGGQGRRMEREGGRGKFDIGRDADATVGRPLQLPGMVFAPTCEAGVVYLFGLMAPRLGYSVEQIGTAFPDCLALKAVEGKGERWRRVRVEFEHRSSNFRLHGHNAAACDVIVCWEHDWKGCPLEVVELKGELAKLAA